MKFFIKKLITLIITLLCISAIRKHLMSIQTFIMMNFQNF